jgi:hypothetical protein
MRVEFWLSERQKIKRMTNLSHAQTDSMHVAIVILNLDGPGLVIVIILVGNVHD